MKFPPILICFIALAFSSTQIQAQVYSGFFNFRYEESSGKLLLELNEFDKEFLLVSALGTGIGSNDLGLDRGKLGKSSVVKFSRHGDRILLEELNLDYRAISPLKAERKAVEEAFAFSVLYGFKIEKQEGKNYYIDLAPFLMEDMHNVVQLLKDQKQGTYKTEKSRCALYFPNIHAFPDNCEYESILTLTGEPAGEHIKSVTPTPTAVSYRQHVSFIRLPDGNYKPRKFHPNSGYFYTSYYDYATPIEQPIEKKNHQSPQTAETQS